MLNTDNLTRMRALIDSLEGYQDQEIPDALQRIEEYVPLSMSVWRVCCNDNIVFSKGNGIINEQALNLNRLFTIVEGKNDLLEAHQRAFRNENCSLMISEKDKAFFIRLVPEASELEPKFVTGFAIDVSDVVRGLKGNDV